MILPNVILSFESDYVKKRVCIRSIYQQECFD
jgi:hypothetical protein